jgi:hypothetical protein
MTESSLKRLGLATALIVALCYTSTDAALTSPNERSRLYLTVAMFEHHSYCIDEVVEKFGPIFDVAFFDGHLYSDKAPGASLLALLPFALLRSFVGSEAVTSSMLLAIGRYAVMVPIAMATFYAVESLCSALGIGRSMARWASLAYFLGSPAFHFGAAFFGHQIVAACFVVALALIIRQKIGARPRSDWQFALAGLLVGIAGITEYQSLIGIVTVSTYVAYVSRRDGGRSFVIYALSGSPFALWLAHYHALCFGGPFELSYHHLADPILSEVHRHGMGGVSWPSLSGLVGALFSWHRGLLATSPFFALAPMGLWGLCRRGHGAVAVLLGLTAALYVGFVAASATWEAGWGYGCRLLVPLLPILTVLVAEGLDVAHGSTIAWGLASSGLVVAVASFQAVTAVFAEPPDALRNPWLDVVLPLGKHSLVGANLGSTWLGLHGWISLLPLGLVLAWPLGQVVRAAQDSVRSSAWLLWVPVVPIVWTWGIALQGCSATPLQRDEFVEFVSSLRENPAPTH